jgi:hypothetical protein
MESKIKKFLIVTLFLGASSASAGWFGPSNYRECVLDEAKGKPAYLLPTVKGLCNEKFPCAEPTPEALAKCNTMTDTPNSIPGAFGGSVYVPTARDFCIDSVRTLACPR